MATVLSERDAAQQLTWALDALIECASNERKAVDNSGIVVDGAALACAFSQVAVARGRLDGVRRSK
jgi:hypothetical protein